MPEPLPKSPSFRKQPVPQPPSPAAVGEGMPVTPAPGGGTLPLPTDGAILSDWDKQQLRHVGWEEGQEIPPDFAQKIKQAQKQAQADLDVAREGLIAQGQKAGGKVKIGKELNLADLPATQQEELRVVLAGYQEHVEEERARQAVIAAQEARVVPNADPSVAQAHRTALAAEDQTAALAGASPQLPEVEIVPPGQVLEPSQLPPEIRPREGAKIAGIENVAPFVTNPGPPQPGQPPPQAVEQPSPEVPPTDQVADAGGVNPVSYCPRCMWDVRQPWELQPEDTDKEQFVAAILGGTRFTKLISVMGGRLQITYRSLTSQETDLVFTQLGIDLRQEKLLDDAQYFMQLQVYRLAMSVERIENGNNDVLAEIPPIFEIEYDPPGPGEPEGTRLVELVKWFNDEAAPQESMRRIIAQHHRQFQRLVEALEAMTSEPDFWKGIALPT